VNGSFTHKIEDRQPFSCIFQKTVSAKCNMGKGACPERLEIEQKYSPVCRFLAPTGRRITAYGKANARKGEATP